MSCCIGVIKTVTRIGLFLGVRSGMIISYYRRVRHSDNTDWFDQLDTKKRRLMRNDCYDPDSQRTGTVIGITGVTQKGKQMEL